MLFIAPLRCLTISRPYQPKPQHNHKFALREATTKTMKNGIISVSTNAIPHMIPQDCRPVHAASDVPNIVVVAIHALVLGCHTPVVVRVRVRSKRCFYKLLQELMTQIDEGTVISMGPWQVLYPARPPAEYASTTHLTTNED